MHLFSVWKKAWLERGRRRNGLNSVSCFFFTLFRKSPAKWEEREKKWYMRFFLFFFPIQWEANGDPRLAATWGSCTKLFFPSVFVVAAVASGIWTHLAVGGGTAGGACWLLVEVATVQPDHCWQRRACSTSCCTSGGKRRRQEMLFQSSDHRRTKPNCSVPGPRFLFEFCSLVHFFFLPLGLSRRLRSLEYLFILARLLTLWGRGYSTRGNRFEKKHKSLSFFTIFFYFFVYSFVF